MPMRTHELHPSIVHAPLVLLPATAVLDLMAALRPRDRRLDRAARRLWWATAGGALVVGLTGMAASQEVELREDRGRDMMFLHGIGNFGLVLAALGVAAWRDPQPRLDHLGDGGARRLRRGDLHGVSRRRARLLVRRRREAARGSPRRRRPPSSPPRRRGGSRGTPRAGSAGSSRAGARAVSGRQKVDRAALGPIAEVGTAAPEQPRLQGRRGLAADSQARYRAEHGASGARPGSSMSPDGDVPGAAR